MTRIFFQLCIVCLALTTQAQETRNPQLPPVRTSDPALRQTAVVKFPQTTVVVPVRKTDGAPAGASAGSGAQDKPAKDNKPAVILPSSLSAKEAREQQQAVQPPPATGTPPKQ